MRVSEALRGQETNHEQLVGQYPRWGYRRITVLLRRDGWRGNRKRVCRLWWQQGLKSPR